MSALTGAHPPAHTGPAPPPARKAEYASASASTTGELGELQTSTPPALAPFFWLASRAPWVVQAIGPAIVCLVPMASRAVRQGTTLNARRIFGRALAPREQQRFTRAVVKSFYGFIADVGRSTGGDAAALLSRIEQVEGEEAYRELRARGGGAVLVTAHMGSFEVGLAALTRAEKPGVVRVVYKRDASGAFEAMRARLRRMLGVVEAPIDDGLTTWMDLRDALHRGGVVVMQADRAMPGQRSEVVPFLYGHLRIPTGAVRLARMTGCPIVPVYTVRTPSGNFAVHLHAAIDAGPGAPPGRSDAAVAAVARSIESMVRTYPDQWLVLGAAFEEDAPRA
ncbi:MAG TPA: lysophospholipid acyltransferase family protein [Phycisphaerales bacterium]|nr:lysophospholipid acyltransferase family protein [Phycisphaerales bacterium]